MRAYLIVPALAIILAVNISNAWAEEPLHPDTDNTIIATVNGHPITKAQILAADPTAENDPKLLKFAANTLINQQIILQQIKKDGYEKNKAMTEALDNAKNTLMIKWFLEQYQKKHPASLKQIEAHYHELEKNAPKYEYRLREIIVNNYKQAHHLMKELQKGDNFSNLAATQSLGPNAALGGEVGWLNNQQVPASILEHIRTLKVGELVGPIEVPEGFAIVQLLDERPTQILPLASVQSKIQDELDKQKISEFIMQLRKNADIHWQPQTTANTGGRA